VAFNESSDEETGSPLDAHRAPVLREREAARNAPRERSLVRPRHRCRAFRASRELKRGGVVVPSIELAQHVERILNDRGGVRGANDLGVANGDSALEDLAHQMASASKGEVSFATAKRALYRIRTC
jgi:hypothetical protein